MTALVLFVTARLAASTSMQYVSRSQSTQIGVAPVNERPTRQYLANSASNDSTSWPSMKSPRSIT